MTPKGKHSWVLVNTIVTYSKTSALGEEKYSALVYYTRSVASHLRTSLGLTRTVLVGFGVDHSILFDYVQQARKASGCKAGWLFDIHGYAPWGGFCVVQSDNHLPLPP